MNESTSSNLCNIYIVSLNLGWGVVCVGEWSKTQASCFASFCLCI